MAVLLLHVAGRISDLMVSMVAVMSLVTSFVSFLALRLHHIVLCGRPHAMHEATCD